MMRCHHINFPFGKVLPCTMQGKPSGRPIKSAYRAGYGVRIHILDCGTNHELSRDGCLASCDKFEAFMSPACSVLVALYLLYL